jgi:hypothetical protein
MAEVCAWWRRNAADGKTSLLLAYALGKAQRVIAGVSAANGPIFIHPAVEQMAQVYRVAGVRLPPTRAVETAAGREELAGALVIAPPGVEGSSWMNRFVPRSLAFASGWMRIRGNRRRRALDRGFVLSDHADWPALLQTIAETAPSGSWTTHGYADEITRFLREKGLAAEALREPSGGGGHVKHFAALYAALDRTTGTAEKVRTLSAYFAATPAADAAWALSFLIGRRPRRLSPPPASSSAGRHRGGGRSRSGSSRPATKRSATSPRRSRCCFRPTGRGRPRPAVARLDRGAAAAPARPARGAQREALLAAWRGHGPRRALAWNKLITGGWRVGVSQNLVVRALAEQLGVRPRRLPSG